MVPQKMKAEDDPELSAIRQAAVGFHPIEIDVLATAQGLDETGARSANVLMGR